MTESQFPKMPWYPRDFASSTRTWPLDARGVYHELLDLQWDLGGLNPGTLPADPEELRAIVRATPTQWKVAWRYVEPKFPTVDGGRRNERLEEHRRIAVRTYQARRQSAEKTNALRLSRRANGHDRKEEGRS